MILREIRLIGLIIALCAIASVAVVKAYENKGAVSDPLLIAVALIVGAILTVEVFTRSTEGEGQASFRTLPAGTRVAEFSNMPEQIASVQAIWIGGETARPYAARTSNHIG